MEAVSFQQHDAILNTLDRVSKDVYLSKESFIGTEQDWDGTDVVFAENHPDPLLYMLNPDLALKEFPPLHSLSSHHHNLPIQATPFLGRE